MKRLVSGGVTVTIHGLFGASMSYDDSEINWVTFMPFINVKSAGGKFDDSSFCAGFEMGSLDCRLFQASAIPAENFFMTLIVDNESQADLIAMKHGYIIEQKIIDQSGFWMTCLFTRSTNIIDFSKD